MSFLSPGNSINPGFHGENLNFELFFSPKEQKIAFVISCNFFLTIKNPNFAGIMSRYINLFQKFELHDRVKEAVTILGFRRATRVQEQVIPLFFQGKNLIVEAPTGTGKTAAYGLPLISRLNLLKRSTQAFILLPTRELAIQVAESLKSYFTGKELKVGIVIGGVPLEESFQEIKAGPHILVAVPGRLRDVLSSYNYPYIWRDIKHLIIDEGDKMMELGFLKEVDNIRKEIRNTAQVAFFSATISADAEKQIRERIENIQVIRIAPKEVLRNLRFFSVEVKGGKREQYLCGLLEQTGLSKALIFCNRREDIYGLSGYLRSHGFRAESYYGSQEQNERENIMRRFKEDHIDFLIASDLAARGLDIVDLPAVINFTVPKELDFYMHRIGRTGRAGNRGMVFNLLSGTMEEAELSGYHQYLQIRQEPLDVSPLENRKLVDDDLRRIKLHISRGNDDKIRKADIVGFLVNSGGTDAEDIGTITVYDSYAIADIPLMTLDNLLKQEEALKVKGKSVKVRKFGAEEEENKATALKVLLKQRVKAAPARPVLTEQQKAEKEKAKKLKSKAGGSVKSKRTDNPKTDSKKGNKK